MKKITLLLSLLCVMCFSATAQICSTEPTESNLLTSLEDVSADSWFVLKSNGNQGQNRYVTDAFSGKLNSVDTYAGSGVESTLCLWRLVSAGEGVYKLQNAATGRYLPVLTSGDIHTVTDVKAGTLSVQQTTTSGTWIFKNSTDNMCLDMDAGGSPVPWSGKDDALTTKGNNWYQIYKVDVTYDATAFGGVLEWAKTMLAANTALVGVPGYASEVQLQSLKTAVNTADAVTEPTADDASALREVLGTGLSGTVTYPTDKYFVINNTDNRGAIIYRPEASVHVDANHGNAEYIWTTGKNVPAIGDSEQKAVVSLDATDVNHLWAFYKNPDNNEYYLYNVGKKMFANPNGKGTYGGATWIFSNTPVAVTMETMAYPAVHIIGGGQTMSVSNGHIGPVITYYSAGDGGVPFIFSESTVTVDADVTNTIASLVSLYNTVVPLQTAVNAAKAKPVSAKVCEYHQQDGDEDMATVLAAAEAMLVNPTDADAISAMTTKLNGLVANLEINKPVAGKFYRFKDSKTGLRRMTSTPSGNKLAMEKKGKNTTPTVFYVDGTHLVAFSNGLCMGNFHKNDQAGAWKCLLPNAVKVGTVEFKESSTLGKLNIVMKGSGQDRYLFNQHDQVNCGSSDGGEGYRWYAEEVDWLPVPFSADVDYATLISPVTLSRFAADGTTERVKAYTGKIEGNYVVLTEISGKFIPANVPVILEKKKGFEDNSIYLKVVSDAASSDAEQSLTGNFLARSSAETDGNCTLQMVDGKTGFYTYSGDVLYGFKAYIDGTATQGVRGFAFQMPGDATGISGVTAGTKGEEVFYDLNGRRVLYPANGIYVTASGKKVLVK